MRMAEYGHSPGQTAMSYPFNPSFINPLPSRATRKPSARSRASSRGHVTGGGPPSGSPPRLRYFESKREQDVLYLLLARPDVVDVWDQPPPVSYQDATGRRRNHSSPPNLWFPPSQYANNCCSGSRGKFTLPAPSLASRPTGPLQPKRQPHHVILPSWEFLRLQRDC